MYSVPRIGGTLQFLAAWLVPWRPTICVRSHRSNLAFFIHRRDAIGRHIAKYGTHEPLVTKWLSDYLNRASSGLFIDVGANIGWHALHAARSRAIETVVAFEPDLSNAEMLSRNCRLNDLRNVVISTSALGGRSGLATLNVYKDSNRGRHSIVTDYGYGSRLVPVIELDVALENLGLGNRPVTVLKIDVEGYEPAVIMGAAQTLERTDAIIMEYSPNLSEKCDYSIDDMVTRLCDSGFSPLALLATGGLCRVDVDELVSFEGQLDTVWLRVERQISEVDSLINNTVEVGDLLELAERNKVILNSI